MASKDPNIFLNAINDLNRDMYSGQGQGPPQGGKVRFEADMLLNQGVLKQNHEAEQSKLIVGLHEENKTLKSKIQMVVEKDEEIYRLQCSNTLLEKDNAELKATTVTDYTLRRDNDAFMLEKADLEAEVQSLKDTEEAHNSEILQLKQTILNLARRSRSVTESNPPRPVSGLVKVNIQELKETVSRRRQISCETRIDKLLQKHQITDNQYITTSALSRVIQDAVLY